jgi:hypothetical protein
MMVALSTEHVEMLHRPAERLIPLKAKIVFVSLVLAVFGFICYGIGTNQGAGAHVLTGRAFVGVDQASVKVDGWVYGLVISPDGMTWYDTNGGSHDGGIPPCLQHPGYAWIRFGYANATGLDGQPSDRVVTWTQCVNRAG